MQELEIKIKLKIAVEVEAGSQKQSIVPARSIEGAHECNVVLTSSEEEAARKSRYKKPDKKFVMFFVPYIVGAVLFLLLIALNIVEWDWKYKAEIFLVSATVALVQAFGRESLLTGVKQPKRIRKKVWMKGSLFAMGLQWFLD
ncbi:hypothetical protein [Gluconobacter kondonii]|uniref:Uncharacterized protein n=1 Tax=Gluconobacter kondonii TaxID=941463 RepID=A0ABQ5WU12_9PROT|nr:hypothetical protein [Gluconobacter kondonii]GBR37176.1 hypothetical protein AA3266_2515 [Gluconobacter kondonii NBRC 3266]GLQ66497.1 hypothetical protein GCM10007870_20810 [Gluconobacter kondonii]